MDDQLTSANEGKARLLIGGAVTLVILFLLFFLARDLLDRAERGPDPETIAATSLEAMQAQNRLVPFSARFVSVVTSRQQRLGGLLEAERTLILPGTARYELDMAKIGANDVRWDEASRTLSVTMPEIEIAGPEVDLEAAREYGESGVLGVVTDTDALLTRANQQGAIKDLRKQAASAVPLNLAREAARDAVRRNFELPLRAAGIDNVRVEARFASDPRASNEQVDVSTSIDNALAEGERRRQSRQ
ncbi:DUF4230 domain-containing protein [Sphingomicrobium flavum]|uniref:DUF4230 domain-containing protein n=1 Tax=Sphingomicrobium flavum TaxID=1229164 RepID=UPI0021AD789C|nr:DUF4230 domain-containing protein [Sphingomicrobium flavum]